MKSRAALGTHPLHPGIVPLPIGSFFVALAADVAHAMTKGPVFYDIAIFAIGLGIVTALLAAVLGLIDYFGVRMSAAGKKLASELGMAYLRLPPLQQECGRGALSPDGRMASVGRAGNQLRLSHR